MALLIATLLSSGEKLFFLSWRRSDPGCRTKTNAGVGHTVFFAATACPQPKGGAPLGRAREGFMQSIALRVTFSSLSPSVIIMSEEVAALFPARPVRFVRRRPSVRENRAHCAGNAALGCHF